MQTVSETGVLTDDSVHPVARLSWRAILAGAIASLSITWLLLILGGAVGLTALEPGRNMFANPSGAASVGIWTVAAVGIGSFLGGLISVRASSIGDRVDAMIQGLTTWAFGFLFTAVFAGFLAAVAGSGALAGAGSALGDGMGRAGTGASHTAQDRGLDAGAGASWVVFASGLLGAICGSAGGVAGMRSRTGMRHPTDRDVPIGRPLERPAT